MTTPFPLPPPPATTQQAHTLLPLLGPLPPLPPSPILAAPSPCPPAPPLPRPCPALPSLAGPGTSGSLGGSASGSARPDAAASASAGLRRQLAELEQENEDLRNELNAFDPSFWDEVMAMKQGHAELTKRVAEYEDVVRDLAGRLGIAPPVVVGGRRSGSAGRTRSAGRA